MAGRRALSVSAMVIGLAVTCVLLSGQHSAGQMPAGSDYRVKPSDVALPANAKLGSYRRITQPFENWILICDENLQTHQKICNVTQTIEDSAGRLAFSWSLAATKDGKPYMILRTTSDAKYPGLVALRFQGQANPLKVELDGCNAAVCVGMLPVGPAVREQIAKSAAPEVSYETTSGTTVTLAATLKGLSKAVEAIK
ncbi:Invasion associated locus B (IalB) protein [Bosea sp. OK403]|uniref:invasion associated locus B family protein n=1 Tax=Bosea sp. OK403 TaxID=1855286 RepID=UPI0008F27CD2|nr:invasion associated locus B family protein [Bosea sp. OK403]SFI04916.1 Invasion associated locus B (IalB) protein [Bosea sp. OK403]